MVTYPPSSCIFLNFTLYYIYYGSTNATYTSTYGKQTFPSRGGGGEIDGMFKMQVITR
jgi:hypothetical protein